MIQFSINDFTKKDEMFNQKFGKALSDGFFYVEIPESLRAKIPYAVKFAEGIRNNTTLKTLELGQNLGYQVRGPHAVAFVALNKQWEKVYPNEVVEVAKGMNDLAVDILKHSLEHLSIHKDLWTVATGNLAENYGSTGFTFNHYTPGEGKLTLIPHKDTGWVSVLFANKVGLERSVDGKKWESIPPKENYFVVNFGRAFEIFVNSEDKLRASLHRVRSLEERFSFGCFTNHSDGTDMYQMDKGNMVKIGTHEQYLEKCFSEFVALQKQQENQDN